MNSYRRAKRDGGFRHYYRCRPSTTLAECPNRKSHQAEGLEYDAACLFELYANRGTLLELYDRAVQEEERHLGLSGSLERRAALGERKKELELERRGYLRQNARGMLSDDDLADFLGEINAQREQIDAELRDTEDAASARSWMEALRSRLLSAEWFEDPDAIQPHEWRTLGASPEQLRRAYMRYGVRFEVDPAGVLTLRLNLHLDGGGRCNPNAHLDQ